ncbi:MAG: TonB-dependent receptor [Ignavibacteriales bacterium]|nr:TonB-dependent receptor [Ignavibacteriales bacterium]
MLKVKQLFSLVMLLVVMFSYQSIIAQGVTTAALNGKITDQKGEELPGANIIAVHQPTGTQYGTTSREDGRYNLLGLAVGGPYKVTVSFVGYTSQVEEGFSLALGQNLKIDFVLPEQAYELSGVTVTAERNAVLSAARTGAAQNVSAKQIQEVPTISRNFQSFAKLNPLFSGSDLSAAGRSSRFNNIQIDGTQYNDLFGLGSTGAPGGQTGTAPISLDAISEFQVLVAPYDVRLSGFTGGGINAITRSGSNNFKGSAYFYGRNESFVGKYGNVDQGQARAGSPDVERKAYPDFKEYQYGFRFGGPIMKDKFFFFVSGELTVDDNPSSNASITQGDPAVISGYKGKADQVKSILANQYGYNAGSYDQFVRERPSDKLIIKLDYNLSDDHKLTLRHNFVDAYQDILGNRSATNTLSFDTYNYRIKSQTNSTVLQLTSTLSNTMSNEFIAGYTRIRDRRAGTGADAPEVLVTDGGFRMSFGPDQFSSANELDQDIFEVTDNFSFFAGDHVFTVGTHNEFFSFRNLFLRAFFGYYEFSSIANLQAGKPSFFLRRFSILSDGSIPTVANDPLPAAKFDVMQFGFYVQDEWSVSPQLKLTIGARIDIPTFPDSPTQNDSVSKYFSGYSTTDVPNGNLLFSPRFGFNYDISGDRTTQLRGGLGVFTGRIPYVWMSNNYGNTGVLYAEVRNATGKSPLFTTNPYAIPGPGDAGTGSTRKQAEINLVNPDLKLPQVLRFNIAVDEQLPWNLIGTVEFQYSKTLNDMLYRKINIGNPIGKIPVIGSGQDGRTVWGGTVSKNGNFFDVLELYNTAGGYQYNIAFQVQRNMLRGLSINTGYVFGQAKDKNSVNSSQAISQMRFNPVQQDANNPALTSSQYEIEHRVFAALSYVYDFFENAPTTISLYYNGQSGSPFSFIVGGDLNNDGFTDNDLFYIPRNKSEILLGTISSGQYVAASEQQYNDLFAFINNNNYLSENKGKISERNGARNPWRNILDLRIQQDIPDIWGLGRLQVSLDILNVLNLINSEWGWDESVFSTYRIASLQGRITHNGKANTPVYSFSKPARNVPWSITDTTSRWAMQFGIRYTL